MRSIEREPKERAERERRGPLREVAVRLAWTSSLALPSAAAILYVDMLEP